MKTDRLIAIIMLLLQHKKISASKLAEMFEVSTRTIYRDIEAINLAGIPIVTYPGANGGVGIMEEFKINNKFFTTSEIEKMLLGLGSISQIISNNELKNTLAKVKSLTPASNLRDIELKSNQISIDITPWIGNKNFHPNFEKIKEALNENKYISFDYLNNKGEKSKRKIEPYRLLLKEGYWYLQAYCTEKEDFRTFKLSRMSKVEILEENFIPRDFDFNALATIKNSGKKIIKIKLKVDELLRDRMIELCGEENIKPWKEKKLIVDFPFIDDEYSYNILLGFGDKCECIAPASIREKLINKIEDLLKIYNK